jgi:hypothetical protein
MTSGTKLLQSLIYEPNGTVAIGTNENDVTKVDVDTSSSTPATTTTTTTPTLQVLDQLLLPDETKYIDVMDIQTTFRVIHDMNIRGMYYFVCISY